MAELAGKVAAAVSTATAGGWDLVLNQAKPLRRAIPSGSVFLFEPVDGGQVRPADDGSRQLVDLQHRPDAAS